MEWLERIETYIYESMGIILPGGICFYYLKFFILNNTLKIEYNENKVELIYGIVIFYILGSVVKVFSQLYYEMMNLIINDIFFNILNYKCQYIYGHLLK